MKVINLKEIASFPPEEKVLHLTLKKKWFDMIISGEKKEEYREMKRYWQNRLQINGYHNFEFKKFDKIIFRNGYGHNAPTIEVKCEGITIGIPKWEWSEDGREQFVIKLGEIIKGSNCTAYQIKELFKTYPAIIIKTK